MQCDADPTISAGNVDKAKEMVIDFRRAGKHQHTLLKIDGAAVERASDVKFLGVRLTDATTSAVNTTLVIKKAQQRLHLLWRLREAGLPTPHLAIFYRGFTENILTYSFTSLFQKLQGPQTTAAIKYSEDR